MKTLSRIQYSKLVLSFSVFLIGFTILYFLTIYLATGSLFYNRLILLINIALSIVGGWILYKSRYHVAFSFDELGFIMQRGKKERVEREWRDFSRVSLLHLGGGVFAIRLYDKQDKFVDIPVSALKLNPSEFRFEVMQLIKGK